jgi:hypothetical protein
MLGYVSPMAFEKKPLAEKERARHAIEFFYSSRECGAASFMFEGQPFISALCLA